MKIYTHKHTCIECGIEKNKDNFLTIGSILTQGWGKDEDLEYTPICGECEGDIYRKAQQKLDRAEWQRKDKERVEILSDGYCNFLMRSQVQNNLSAEEIPKELIDIKRQTLIIKRKIKKNDQPRTQIRSSGL
jgi:hypothetical protein